MNGLDIRPVSANDLPALQAFSDRLNRAGSSTFRPDFYHWQFVEPAEMLGLADNGPATFQAAFAPDGQVMGYCAGHAMTLRWHGRPIAGTWLHEWFVDPSASGIGFLLLDRVTRNADFIATAGGSIDTNSVLLRVAPATLWTELQRVAAILDPQSCLRLMPATTPAKALGLLKTLQGRNPVDDAVVEDLPVFGAETDACWQESVATCHLAGQRDAAYMQWRYARHPIFHYDRILVRTTRGDAIFVWRRETVGGINDTIQVARLCDVLGKANALTAAVPALLRRLRHDGLALCDFFCGHATTVDALIAGGMNPVVTTPYSDLPRLFSPLAADMRRTINVSCFLRNAEPSQLRLPSRCLFTKGDGNQDRPNP